MQIDVAVKVASVLKFRANEFNEKLQADEELVRMAEEGIEDTCWKASIPAAISHVTNIVRMLFECNEKGEGEVIWGKGWQREELGKSREKGCVLVEQLLDEIQCGII